MSLEVMMEPVWTSVKYISVDTIDGRHVCFQDVRFRTNAKNLIIKVTGEQIFYNLDNVVSYRFSE